jgi:hypothetical protein
LYRPPNPSHCMVFLKQSATPAVVEHAHNENVASIPRNNNETKSKQYITIITSAYRKWGWSSTASVGGLSVCQTGDLQIPLQFHLYGGTNATDKRSLRLTTCVVRQRQDRTTKAHTAGSCYNIFGEFDQWRLRRHQGWDAFSYFKSAQPHAV